MKTNYLLPQRFKKIGWVLFVPAIILAIYYFIVEPEPEFLNFKVFGFIETEIMGKTQYFSLITNNLLDEIIGSLLIISSVFIALSKQKNEDEFIAKIRLESLVWATYINYAILLVAILFVYGFAFFWIIVFNMFTILLFFIIRFNWVLYKSSARS